MSKYDSLFLRISACLTGFEVVELEATGMAPEYLKVVTQSIDPGTVAGFFAEAERILQAAKGDPARIAPLIAANLFPISCFGGLAQNIIYLWYAAQWQPYLETTKVPLQAQRNISSKAYVQALVWPAAETHPPGAKQQGYGSWATAPLTAG